mmetsp:Transcript_12968/g.36753  ORF Transcript_12968/g.36753 Transcript_12968/m.36753 type:complete len:386 (+) Transcript_12968:624-1781(+)
MLPSKTPVPLGTALGPLPRSARRPRADPPPRASHHVLEEGGVVRVGEVREPAVDGALAGDERLGGEAHEGHHGKPPVLDLLGAQLHHLLVALEGHPQGVEPPPARVAHVLAGAHVGLPEDGVHVHAARVLHVLPPPGLRPAHEEQLGHEERQGGGEVLGLARLRPHRHVQRPALRQHLGDHDADDAEHGPAGVLQLGLLEPLEELGVGAQGQRVEPVVARQRAVEVRRRRVAREPHGPPRRPRRRGAAHLGCHGRDVLVLRVERGAPLHQALVRRPLQLLPDLLRQRAGRGGGGAAQPLHLLGAPAALPLDARAEGAAVGHLHEGHGRLQARPLRRGQLLLGVPPLPEPQRHVQPRVGPRRLHVARAGVELGRRGGVRQGEVVAA